MKTLLRSGIALLLLLPCLAFAAPVAFEDVDCDGTFTPGVDNVINPGVPGTPAKDLFIDSPYCLVIPKGSISAQAWGDLFINAVGDVTMGATLKTTADPNRFGGAWVKGGTLTILPGTRITSFGDLYVGSNTGRLVIGDSAAFTSQKGYADIVAYHGDVIVGRGVLVQAFDPAIIRTPNGRITAGIGGLKVTATDGRVDIRARDGVTIIGATIKAVDFANIEAAATPLVFKNSRILFEDPANAFGQIISILFANPCCAMGPVDVTGSQFPHGEVFIGGDPIVGP